MGGVDAEEHDVDTGRGDHVGGDWLMAAKYAYCPFGHPRPLWMEACPACSTDKGQTGTIKAPKPEGRYGSRANEPTNVTPVTESSGGANVTRRGGGSGKGQPRLHKTNAERQAAYRQRSQ